MRCAGRHPRVCIVPVCCIIVHDLLLFQQQVHGSRLLQGGVYVQAASLRVQHVVVMCVNASVQWPTQQSLPVAAQLSCRAPLHSNLSPIAVQAELARASTHPLIPILPGCHPFKANLNPSTHSFCLREATTTAVHMIAADYTPQPVSLDSFSSSLCLGTAIDLLLHTKPTPASQGACRCVLESLSWLKSRSSSRMTQRSTGG